MPCPNPSIVNKLPKKGPLAFDTVYHDSLAGMRLIESESIDLVITFATVRRHEGLRGGFGGFHPENYVESGFFRMLLNLGNNMPKIVRS